MKKQLVLCIVAIFTLVAWGTGMDVVLASTGENSQLEGSIWIGTLRVKQEEKPGLGDKAEVRFYSEWSLGESAGNVYPKKFTVSATGTPVKLNSFWDNGGEIPAGTYDVVVDIDGMPKKGTLRKLKLEKGISYKIYIFFKAAKIDIPLAADGDQVVVFPAGTHDKYEKLGRLNNIPNELVINVVTSYTERNPIYWLMPAGVPVDVLRTFANGEAKWFVGYTAIPESFIKKLP